MESVAAAALIAEAMAFCHYESAVMPVVYVPRRRRRRVAHGPAPIKRSEKAAGSGTADANAALASLLASPLLIKSLPKLPAR
jgi:hypothetical protein